MLRMTDWSSSRPWLLRSSGARPKPAADRSAHRPLAHGLSVDGDLACRRLAGAVHRLEDLRTSRADKAGQPDDLAGAHGERHVGELARPGQALDLQHRLAERGGVVLLREHELDRPAGHQPDQLRGGGVGHRQAGGDRASVLEDGDPVADLPDLLEAVRDVDDGDTFAGQVADDAEQVLDLAGVQDRGRLVHHDESGVVRQGPRHAHDLLAGRGQPTHLTTRRDVGVPQPAQQVSGRGPGLPRSGEPGVGVLVAQEDVLRDREPVDQVELLVDRRHADLHRGDRVAEPDLLAEPGDGALVGLVGAGEDLDQGGLPGAVLPEQRVHLAGPDVEVDAVQRAHAGEHLDDAGHRQQRLCPPGSQPWESTESEIIRAAPTTPACGPSSDRTMGRLPVASGSDRR